MSGPWEKYKNLPTATPVPPQEDQASADFSEEYLLEEAKKAGLRGKELAAFMAQMAHESWNFTKPEEAGGGRDSYGGGKDYKGRGFIQLTHDYNYKKYGDQLGLDLVSNPDLAKDPKVASQIALKFWENEVRPKVSNWDNVFEHSKAINLPSATDESQVMGMEDRKKKYEKYSQQFSEKPQAAGAGPWAQYQKPATAVAKAGPWTQYAKAAAPEEQDAIRKEIEGQGWFERPKAIAKVITDKEIEQIAGKYGASAEKVRDVLPYMTGLPENLTAADIAKGAVGFIGEAVGFGIPQKLYTMTQDPATQKALDEVRELVEVRKPYLQTAAEMLMPGGIALKSAKGATTLAKTGKAALSGTVTGAAAGFGGSRTGEEALSTAVGAGVGTVLAPATGAAIVGGAKAVDATRKYINRYTNKGQKVLTKSEQKAIQDLAPNLDELEKETAKTMQENPGNALIQDYAMGTKNIDELSPETATTIARAELSEDAIKAYTNPETAEGKLLFGRLNEKEVQELGVERTAIRQLAREIIEKEKASYIESVTGKKYTDPYQIEEAWKFEQRKKNVAEEFAKFRLGQRMDQIITERGMHDIDPESRLGQLVSKVSDARFALRTIDTKFKMKLEIVLDELSKNRNLMGAVRESDKKVLDDLYALAENNDGLAAAKNGKLFDALDTGDFSKLSEGEKIVAKAVKEEYKRFYDFITKDIEEKGIKGLAIPQVQNYMSRMSLPISETISKIGIELRQAVEDTNKLLGTNYTDVSQLTDKDLIEMANESSFKNLQSYINWVAGMPVQINNGAQLSKLIQESTRSEGAVRLLDKTARGAMERDAQLEGIPDFIKEKNIFRALDRYSQDMLSYVYQREPLSKMKFYADRLDKIGAKNEAEYVRNIIEDTWGVRKGTVAHYMREARNYVAKSLDPKIEDAIKSGNTTQAFVLNSIKEMQDIPGFLSSQIYPNLLGWRPVPIIQNVFSGLARTAPELGTKYGYTTYLRGLTYAIKNWSAVTKELETSGLIPQSFTRTGQRAIADGIRASKAVNTSLKGLDALSRLGMTFYEASERLNRASILGISKMMADDLARNNKLAVNSLKKFPWSVQQEVASAGKDYKKIESIIATHLNGSTAFNYNRPSLYEFGRTMGPMFATFAKWPTAIAGEVASEIRTKGLPRGLARSAERYAGPLMAFAAVDYLLQEPLQELVGEQRAETIVGKTGLKKAAPVSSLAGFVAGDIFTPPMIDTVMQDILIPATNAEGVKLVKGLDRTVFTYAPGAGFVKFITDFVPTMVFGERPEGGTQTEKTAGGAEMLGRLLK